MGRGLLLLLGGRGDGIGGGCFSWTLVFTVVALYVLFFCRVGITFDILGTCGYFFLRTSSLPIFDGSVFSIFFKSDSRYISYYLAGPHDMI